jgi:hypothetical protein
MVVSQCNPPQEILDKYPRRFVFKDTELIEKQYLLKGLSKKLFQYTMTTILGNTGKALRN